ncbi:MAG: hypothetical protein AAGA30_19600, partial [Planctomycetota bacterium]
MNHHLSIRFIFCASLLPAFFIFGEIQSEGQESPASLDLDLVFKKSFVQFISDFEDLSDKERRNSARRIIQNDIALKVAGSPSRSPYSRFQQRVKDPGRWANWHEQALAVKLYFIRDQKLLKSLAQEYLAKMQQLCSMHSHHVQNARIWKDLIDQFCELSEPNQVKLSSDLIRFHKLRHDFVTGQFRSEASIENSLRKFDKLGERFANILKPNNWLTHSCRFYRNRNKLVTKDQKIELENSLAAFSEHRHIKPNHLWLSKIRMTLANHEAAEGNLAKARELLRTVQKNDQKFGTTNENFATVQLALADLSRLSGEKKKAYSIAKTAIEKSPWFKKSKPSVRECEMWAEAHSKMALTQESLGDANGAVQNLTIAEQLWSEVNRFDPARTNQLKRISDQIRIARLFALMRKQPESIACADTASENLNQYFGTDNPFHQRFSMQLATVYARSGQPEVALELVEVAIQNIDLFHQVLAPEALVSFLQQANFVFQVNREFDKASELFDSAARVVDSSNLPLATKSTLKHRIISARAGILLRKGDRKQSFDLTLDLVNSELKTLPQSLLKLDES